MFRRPLPFALFLATGLAVASQPSTELGNVPADALRRWDANAAVTHRVILDAPQTQMATIETRVRGVQRQMLEFTLPTWRPGRYVVLDFAGAVQDVSATGADGAALPVRKTSKTTWAVATQGAQDVTLRYRIYANELNTRTRHIDDTHAFLSGSSVFMLVSDQRDRPQRVELDLPDGWQIAGGLDRHPDHAHVLLAENYDVLVDAPLELGRHERHTFEVEQRPHELIVWGRPLPDPERLVADLERLVATQHAFWGTVPYGRYVWLLHLGPDLSGGTEHLNSTIMQARPERLKPGKQYRGFLALCSHEFFHTWNVKRLRPAGISPYDYTRENYTYLLWVAEGSTSYYDDLLLVRAGLLKPDQYFDQLSDRISGFRNRPGRAVQSLAMSSYDAWIKFNQPHDHSANSTVSFYRKGALVNLLLDMQIRAATGNDRSLDDVFREAFHRYPLGGPGLDARGLREIVEQQSGTSFGDFFTRFVDGVDPLPLEEALTYAGLELRRADQDDDNDDADDEQEADDAEVSLGLTLRDRGGLAAVTRVAADGPAFPAGIQTDDLLVALDGDRVRAGKLDDLLAGKAAGEEVELTLLRRDRLRTVRVTLAPTPEVEFEIRRVSSPSDLQKRVYESWLGTPWPEEEADSD